MRGLLDPYDGCARQQLLGSRGQLLRVVRLAPPCHDDERGWFELGQRSVPNFEAARRNGRSDTPVIGAVKTRPAIGTPPI